LVGSCLATRREAQIGVRDLSESVMEGAAPQIAKTPSALGRIAVWGPGLLVMLADTDAGNVVTGAQAGASWGYRLLPLLLALIPMLYMVQELTVRLGLSTGRGYGELVREHFGLFGAWISLAGLAVAVIGSLVTEFTGVAGVGQLYGLSRGIVLPIAALALLAVVGTGSYRRVERVAICVGLFELAFFVVAWAAHPSFAVLVREATDIPFGNRDFLYLTAAIIGAVFNPWMIFYQQSAIADKKLDLEHLRMARLDTAFGATLTQCLTAAVLIAAAATLRKNGSTAGLDSVGQISDALSLFLGDSFGRAAFSAGVLGASMVAAIVCSLALAWGVGEITGYKHSLEYRPFAAGWFYGVYAACVIGSAALVGLAPDLIQLNVAAQVLNALLLPLVIGFLIALSVKALPDALRPKGAYLWILILVCTLVVAIGVFGALQGVFAFS
jgi:Mn2+/Fe2+ NRAMP family transporter